MWKFAFIGLCLTACLEVRALRQQVGQATEIVGLSQAEEAEVTLRMATGRLMLSGGAEHLLVGRFSYQAGKPPRLLRDYTWDSARVRIRGRGLFEVWTVYLINTVPIGLNVAVRRGSVRLLLGGINLDRLGVSVGRGDTYIDMASYYPSLRQIAVEQGSGPLNMEMSGGYPLLKELKIQENSGPISLEFNGQFAVLEKLEVSTGSGPANILLTGQLERLQQVTISGHGGSIALNLEADWKRSSTVRVNALSGEITLHVPFGVGCIVYPSIASGSLKVHGLEGTPDSGFVNSAYGKTSITLTVYVDTTTGNLNLLGAVKGATKDASKDVFNGVS